MTDHDVGHVFEFGNITMTKEDIIEFARKYDPHPFHVDEKIGIKSMYGGIIASG